MLGLHGVRKAPHRAADAVAVLEELADAMAGDVAGRAGYQYQGTGFVRHGGPPCAARRARQEVDSLAITCQVRLVRRPSARVSPRREATRESILAAALTCFA